MIDAILDALFLQILNMSFVASFVIVFVLAGRLLLKKLPKIFSYALWSVVLFRLICPFSFESVFSLLPAKANPFPLNIASFDVPKADTGITLIDNAINASLSAPPDPSASANPLQILLFLGRVLWLMGIAILLIYSVISLVRLHIHLKDSIHDNTNIYTCTALRSPFVMGLIRPRIYLPASLTEKEKQYILLHEQTHIRRFDHVIKIISFFVLCLHWFNPLVWAAFFLSGRDMEMSCDESVIKKLGSSVKKEYSSSLLALATGRPIIGGTPLAFGEGDTRVRIKNILNYKMPGFWVLTVSIVIVASACAGFAVNPKNTGTKDEPARFELQSKLFTKLLSMGEIGGTAVSTVFIDDEAPEGRLCVYITFGPSQSLSPEQQSAIKELVQDMITGITAEQIFIENEYFTNFTLYNQEGKIAESNKLSSPRIAAALASLLLTGTDKTQDSVNDVPVNADEYLKVEIGEDSQRIYYVYQNQDTFWVEKPYDYKRELDKKTYWSILNYLYKTQSQ